MNCYSTKMEYVSSIQANSKICTITSRKSLTNEQILFDITKSILNLSQKSVDATNSSIYSLQKTVECTMANWAEVCKYIANDIIHTECSDRMIFRSIQIDVVDLIGSDFCVATEDASKLYDEISHNVMEKTKVIVSFDNVILLTPIFLNISICQLYGQFEEDIINDYLIITNLDEEDKRLLSILIKKAKHYFKNPAHYIKLIRGSSGESNE